MVSSSTPASFTVPASTASGRSVSFRTTRTGFPREGASSCIPPESDTVVAVAGLTALGKPLYEVCFRCDLVCALLGAEPGDCLTPELLARLLTHPLGQYKDVGAVPRFRLLLNQADDDRLLALGMETAEAAHRELPGVHIVLGMLKREPVVRAVLRG